MSKLEDRMVSVLERMPSPCHFSEELRNIPGGVGAALLTNRPELLTINLADEALRPYLEVIRILMETNQLLREYCQCLGQLTGDHLSSLTGAVRKADRIRNWGRFQVPIEEEKDV